MGGTNEILCRGKLGAALLIYDIFGLLRLGVNSHGFFGERSGGVEKDILIARSFGFSERDVGRWGVVLPP